jgi:hypothetical protein
MTKHATRSDEKVRFVVADALIRSIETAWVEEEPKVMWVPSSGTTYSYWTTLRLDASVAPAETVDDLHWLIVLPKRLGRQSEAPVESAGLSWHLVLSDAFGGALSRILGSCSGAWQAPPQQHLDLEPYSGEWVVISNDQVVEHGPDLADVVGRARRRGEPKPYVVFVEEVAEGAARIGL